MKGEKSHRQPIEFISASPTSATSCLFTFSKLLFTHIWTIATIQAGLGTQEEGKKDPVTPSYRTITAVCGTCAKTFTTQEKKKDPIRIYSQALVQLERCDIRDVSSPRNRTPSEPGPSRLKLIPVIKQSSANVPPSSIRYSASNKKRALIYRCNLLLIRAISLTYINMRTNPTLTSD